MADQDPFSALNDGIVRGASIGQNAQQLQLAKEKARQDAIRGKYEQVQGALDKSMGYATNKDLPEQLRLMHLNEVARPAMKELYGVDMPEVKTFNPDASAMLDEVGKLHKAYKTGQITYNDYRVGASMLKQKYGDKFQDDSLKAIEQLKPELLHNVEDGNTTNTGWVNPGEKPNYFASASRKDPNAKTEPPIQEHEFNAATFAKDAYNAEEVLTQIPGFRPTEGGSFLPNRMKKEDRQLYDQAVLAFTDARLRKVSGAAIGDKEYVKTERRYFPQPGDSYKVLVQKEKDRKSMIKSLSQEGKRVGDSIQPGSTQGLGRSTAKPAAELPKAGLVQDGYKFKGGDPANPKNWMKQ